MSIYKTRVRLFTILILGAGMACGRDHVDQAKFDRVYRAGKAMSSATGVGTDVLRFSELLQNFASEVSIARDKAQSTSEWELIRLYEDALKAYYDSRTIWQLKLNGTDRIVNSSVSEEVKRIEEQYPIRGQGSGSGFSFKVDDAIQTIWARASAKLQVAEDIYNAKKGGA
jgi:hypothetical protein